MAVSHVWSDGTGVGVQNQGTVNSCLLDYWIEIAKSEGCDGIWWDAISLPVNPTPRRNALAVMLQNFENAALVIIHDKDLINMSWPEELKPQHVAVALVLSSWFTRGWTAAELAASSVSSAKIAVVVPNPDKLGSKPKLMNLKDILVDRDTYSGSFVPTLAHLYASKFLKLVMFSKIGDMRFGPINHFETLIRVLRTRSTAWDKDRTVIATLMSSYFKKNTISIFQPTPKLTQALLSSIARIPSTTIFHGEPPMRRYGGWSWCPLSIFQLGNYDDATPQNSALVRGSYLEIDKHGIASTCFFASTVVWQDLENIHAVSSHPVVIAQIYQALEAPDRCLLLRTLRDDPESKMGLSLLVMLVDYQMTEINTVRFSCRYVGSVNSVWKERYINVECLIGDDKTENGEPMDTINAEEAFKKAEEAKIKKSTRSF